MALDPRPLELQLLCLQDALSKRYAVTLASDNDGYWKLSIPLGDRWGSRYEAEVMGRILSDALERHLLAQLIGLKKGIDEVLKARALAATVSADRLPR